MTRVLVALIAVLSPAFLSHAQDTNEVMAIMYSAEAITTASCTLPTTVSFAVECGQGGILRQLSADEGLDLAACSLDDGSTSSMTCVDDTLLAFHGATMASIVFACEGATDTSRKATVTLLQDDVDCTDGYVEAYGRSLNVAQICPTVPQFVSLNVQPQDTECSNGAAKEFYYSCSSSGTCGAFTGQDCGANMPLIAMSATVTEPYATTPCLWSPAALSTGRVGASSVPLSTPLEASYQAVLTASAGESIYGDNCSFDAPAQVSLSCGDQGELTSADLDSSGICTRSTPGSYECQIDLSSALDTQAYMAVTALVSCRGPTRESLALDVFMDPQSMQCTKSSVSPGSELATLGFSLFVYQTCPTLLLEYASTVSQQCAPITATTYANYTDDAYDIRLAGELCGLILTNCHVGGLCDDQGKQKLPRIKSYVLADDVDLICAGGGNADGVEGGDAAVAPDQTNTNIAAGGGVGGGGIVPTDVAAAPVVHTLGFWGPLCSAVVLALGGSLV